MTVTLAEAWETLSGPRVEDYWVEVLDLVTASPPPVNIITGDSADFEGGTLGGWIAGGSVAPTLTSSTVRANEGARSMLVTWGTGGAFTNAGIIIDTIAGHTYTARLYAWVPTGSPDLGVVIAGDPSGLGLSTSGIVDSWARIEVTWTAVGVTSFIQLWPGRAPVAGEQAWVDQFTVYDHDDGRPGVTTEATRGTLDGVTSCRVEHNVNAVIRGGMSLTVRDTGQDVDWSRIRLRPWVRVNDMTWPLGVFLPASVSESHDAHGKDWQVACVDKLAILDEDALPAPYVVPPGGNLVAYAGSVVESTGERLASTPSTLTAPTALHWQPTTTRLQVVNEILQSVNYFSVWADRRGLLRAEPYRRPQDRTVAATFAEGEAAIHSPQWEREQATLGIPNRVVVRVEGDDEWPGVTGVAENTDPASPSSIPARGRVITRTRTDLEAADQATADALAARLLAEASTPSATLSVSHAPVPLDGNDVVRFASGGRDTLAVVEQYSLDLRPGALMTGVWREVVWQ